jgi:hypothetical protein
MPPKTALECRETISDLIAEAVPETNDARREGLLTLADHWIESLEHRKAKGRAEDGASED